MTSEELLSEVSRLNAVCSKPIGEQETQRRTAFLAELSRKFLWLTLAQWRDVMTWVIDNHKTRALPTLEEFGRGVSALRSSGKIQGFLECESCNGSTNVYRRFRLADDDEVFDGMVPCPACRGHVHYDLKRGLEIVDDARTHKERLADSLTPAGARFAFDLATKMGISFDDATTETMLQRTTEPDLVPLVVVDRDLPENVDQAAWQMRQVIENKRREQRRFTPKRAPPKAEWVQPIDAQSRAAGETEA